ncbi:MAG: hypothetical protein Q9226_006518 [Calogaya cf. arnoldii]
MGYLKFILNETLRLHPPIPLNVRFAKNTTWLPRGGGPSGNSPVLVRKGTGIVLVPYYMHRRKDIYGEDAMDFRPERWEGPELDDIGWAYMPFHGGPRLCLGKDFTLMEASCLIVRILQQFPNIRLPPGHAVVPTGEEKQELTVFLRSADGCSNETPLDTFYENYFITTGEKRMEALLPLFEKYDVFDHWNLKQIHLIILGWSSVNLAIYLSISIDEVDVFDSWGRTPLMWAAWRGDSDSVALLLDHGADPQATSFDGNPVLIYATYGGDLDCMSLILSTGADINHTSN